MGDILKDELVVTSDTKYLMMVRDFVGQLVRKSRLSSGEENKIILAVDEAVTNIIEHGYGNDPAGRIEIGVEADESRFRIVIRDSGKAFDPDSVASPEMRKHVAAGKKRGLGIFLMRQIMNEVRYQYQGGIRNELTLVKYIE